MVWNYNKSLFTIQFDDLPLNKELKIKLLNWHEVLSDETNETTKNPISIEVQSLCNFNLISGKFVQNNKICVIEFWKGIYSKWAKAEIIGQIDKSKPVIVDLIKLNKKSWRINLIYHDSSIKFPHK
jgi:hypothetical protein